ncbi:MAG TPA: VWA domain-containing protein [Terriglobales bacterium]|nr:VWA domain-containing protein [Terriglobales bacterium]
MLRTLRFRIAIALALILNLVTGPVILTAQQPSADEPSITIRTNTRLVTLDVVVTDKKGQPVTGLKPENFTVEENGKKQKVSLFAAPGTDRGPKPTPAPAGILSNHPENVGPAGIPTVLLLDACNSPFKDQAYARSQMLKYVVEQGESGHSMAVLTLTDRLGVLQQFTSDPQVLMTAIKNLRPQEQILQSSGPVPESHGISTVDLGRGGGGGAGAAALASAQAAAQQFADLQVGYNLERRTLITIEAMKALARILGGLPGRKNVVWLTASLPFDLVPEDRNMSEAELLADLPGQGRQRSVSTNAAGAYASESRQLHGQDIKEAESQLANASIAIYPVDVTGLMSGMESSATQQGSVFNDTSVSNRAISTLSAQRSSQGTMEEVAAQTGGKAYINQNDIKDGITLAVSDEKASYSLGYYPDNKKWDGKFRNLKVKVDQGDTQLRYRKGFYAVDPSQDKDKKGNFESDVAAALELGAPSTQVSFMAQAKPTDPGKMRVIFLVDAHTLSAEDSGGGKKMNVVLYASLYGADGQNMGTKSTKVDRSFDAATYQQLLDKGMMVPIDMDLPAPGQNLRLAVLDNKTGYIGTATGKVGQ